MERFMAKIDNFLSGNWRKTFQAGFKGLALGAVALWAVSSPVANAQKSPNIDILTAPAAESSAPRLAQNESSLLIDLDRSTDTIESTLNANSGQTIQCRLVIDNFNSYRGYILRIQVDPPLAVEGGNSNIGFSSGDLPNSGIPYLTGGNAQAFLLSGMLVLQDVVNVPASPTDVPGDNSTAYGFDIPIAGDYSGSLALTVMAQDISGAFGSGIKVSIPDPNNNSNTVEVPILSTTITLSDAVVNVVDAGPTSTITPTPTITATYTPTPTATEMPPTATPWIISGEQYFDSDIFVPLGQELIIEPGTDIIFEAYTDNSNKGLEGNLCEIVVEGSLRLEGGDENNIPIRIFSEVSIPPTPDPTRTPVPTYPNPPYFTLARTVDEIQGFEKVAPCIIDYNGDGHVDQLYFGEANGGVYVANHIGGGFFAPAAQVEASKAGSAAGTSVVIDVTSESVPYLFDADNDGLIDLFVGAADGKIRAYENIASSSFVPPIFREVVEGTLRIAEWDPETEEPANQDGDNQSIEIGGGVAPALGDLNGDGIVDLVIGDSTGEVIYFKGFAERDPDDFFNESSYINRLFVPNETLFIYYVDSDEGLAIPSLVDYDLIRSATSGEPTPDPVTGDISDGDLDVLAGRYDGYLRLWQSGLAQGEYVWPFEQFPDPVLGLPKFPVLNYANMPEGYIYEAINPASPELEANPISVADGRAAPSIGRMFGTSELDMIIGTETGQLLVYAGTKPPESATEETSETQIEQTTPKQVAQTSETLQGGWGGIWFKGNSLDWNSDNPDTGSLVENVQILGAKIGIRTTASSPKITNTDVLNSQIYGVVAEDMAFPIIETTDVASNSNVSIAGVLADDYAAPLLEDVKLVRNGYAGLLAKNYAFPLMRGSHPATGHSVVSGNQYGVRIGKNAAPRLGNVTNTNPNDNGLIEFSSNRYYDIYNNTSARIAAENNIWGTFDYAEIDARLFDDDENSDKGMIDFYPLAKFTPDPPPTPTTTPSPLYQSIPTATPTPEPTVSMVVSGEINQPTTWEGEIIIEGDVTVVDSTVLTILPGTIIRFKHEDAEGNPKRYSIRAINSTIISRGKRNNPIIFLPESYTRESISNEDSPKYAGIILDGPSLNKSMFQFSKFYLADVGIEVIDNCAVIDTCEFTYNRKGLIVRATGNLPTDLVTPRIRRCTFDANDVAYLIAGSPNPNFGTEEDPGNNVFLLPDEQPARFDFEVQRYYRRAFSAKGNYYFAKRTNRVLTTYEDLKSRFMPIPDFGLYDPTENPDGAVDALPIGSILQDDFADLPGIAITHPEVWIGEIHFSQDILILSEVTIIRGTQLIAEGENHPKIIVGTGTLYTPEETLELVGSLKVLGEPDSGNIVFQGEDVSPTEKRMWGGLRFAGEDPGLRSILEYCKIQNAVDPILMVGASVDVTHCTIQDFAGVGIQVTSYLHSSDSDYFMLAGQYGDEKTGFYYFPQSPYDIPQPTIAYNLIQDGNIGILSESAKPVLRKNYLVSCRVAGVVSKGSVIPDLGTIGDYGQNKFINNPDFNVINLSTTIVPAWGNAWFIPDATQPMQTEAEIDERLYDNEENYAAGGVEFAGFIKDSTTAKTTLYALGSQEENTLLDSTGLLDIIGAWHTIKGDKAFSTRANANGGVVIDYKDLFYHAQKKWNQPAYKPMSKY